MLRYPLTHLCHRFYGHFNVKCSEHCWIFVSFEPIRIGALPPDPAELHSAEGERDQGDVVHHGVGLPALVHSQAVVDAERLLSLLDQGKLLWDVASKWIPE